MDLKQKLSAALLSTAILTGQVFSATAWAAPEQGQAAGLANEPGKILELSFDGDGGLARPGVKVTMNGTLSYSNDTAHSGQSLRFDGNSGNYLAITDENGGNLLKGYENLTIS